MNDDAATPLGGSLVQLMSGANEALDVWIKAAEISGANGPELIALLALNDFDNRVGSLTVLLATAILRLKP